MIFGKPSYAARMRSTSLFLAGVLFSACIFISGFAGQGCDSGSEPPLDRLAGEASPYLRGHARNPVDWYPWGTEAIERARREGKPIFLSIGYSTCHWCHVMERRVFSDPGIAAFMNAHYVNIKVDREERPDVDEIYMAATQLITGGGGWPNSVFLTPELEPFFAGTYFPPEDLPGRPGFPRVLNLLKEAWDARRDDLVGQAGRVTEAIRSLQREQVAGEGTAVLDEGILSAAQSHLKTRYDAENGGFGPAPKFPAPLRIELALKEYERTGDGSLLSMATHTLDVMMNGGLYDHVGGGFHRYATDSGWRIPHFEKMLYNQADLARVYLLAFEITGETAYRAVAEDVLAFVQREMRDPGGAFYTAVDSETDAVEGRYYLWSDEDIRKTLGADADVFLTHYGLAPISGTAYGIPALGGAEGDAEGDAVGGADVDAEGNTVGDTAGDADGDADGFAGAGVLYVRTERDSVGPPDGLDELRETLRAARSNRRHPVVDTKVITAWNGQMIDAFAFAGLVTDNEGYVDTAAQAADFILDRLWDDASGLHRIYLEGAVHREAFQEDYACLIQGLQRLHEASAEPRWLAAAETLTNRMNERFWDTERGGYFFAEGGEYQIVRTRNAFDGARASGNGMAARSLVSMARLTGDYRYRARAARLFDAYAPSMKEIPGRFTSMILALQDYLDDERNPVRMAGADGGSPAREHGRNGRTGPGEGTDPSGAVYSGEPKVVAGLSVVAGPREGSFNATVSITIEDGWHINGNTTSVPGLVPTALTFNADIPIESAAVSYPLAETIRFAFADAPLAVYRGDVRLGARIEVDPGALVEGMRLYATLYYQPCDDAVCLEPAEITMSAPMHP